MRTLHPDTLAAIKTDHIRAVLIKLDLTPSPVYLSNTSFDVSYNGNIYLGNGSLIGIDSIRQDISIRISTVNLKFDAVDPSLVALFLGQPQHGRDVEVSLAIINSNYSIIGDIIHMYSMIIDGSPSISDNPSKGTATIKQKISSVFANWKQKGGIRTTPASLQRFAPNDTGFDFAAQSGRAYKWGAR